MDNEQFAKYLYNTDDKYDAVKLWLGFIMFHFVGGAIILGLVMFLHWLLS